MPPVLPSLVLCLAAAAAAPAAAQPAAPARGQLLYATHCVECHTLQMHWRTGRKAHDWNSLKAQVRRWQGEARLQWSEEDIEAVARHLNDTIYGFPRREQLARAAGTQR